MWRQLKKKSMDKLLDGCSIRAAAEESRHLCEWKSRRRGSGVCRSAGVCSLITRQILHSSNRTNIAPNNSSVATGHVFGNLYEEKNNASLKSSCLSYRLFETFLPKKQRPYPAAEPGCSCSWMTIVIMWHDSKQKTLVHNFFVPFHCCVGVDTIFGN